MSERQRVVTEKGKNRAVPEDVVIGILVHPNQARQGASVPSLDLF
jgi:hypothetical protein